jgi:hypothetical protein
MLPSINDKCLFLTAFNVRAVTGVETCYLVFSGQYSDSCCEQIKHVSVDAQLCKYTRIEVRQLTGSL